MPPQQLQRLLDFTNNDLRFRAHIFISKLFAILRTLITADGAKIINDHVKVVTQTSKARLASDGHRRNPDQEAQSAEPGSDSSPAAGFRA